LKYYYIKALNIIIRDSYIAITKLEFLGIIKGIRKEAFKASILIGAFKKTGIIPFNPQVVLCRIEERATNISDRVTPEASTP
jgi:hypothetical protein